MYITGLTLDMVMRHVADGGSKSANLCDFTLTSSSFFFIPRNQHIEYSEYTEKNYIGITFWNMTMCVFSFF